MKDPIVEEVRAARMAHTKKFNYDLSEICADLRRIESKSGHELVNRNPKIINQAGCLGYF
ncbi:MAG: hypothetical protein PF904_21690 [Kiritimatiellae bacterium]|jgi:hypothetical protein|nr:hypothetical protein [Kiritimatiellia bacterium]